MRRFHFLAISMVAFAALLTGVVLADIASASRAPAGSKRPPPNPPAHRLPPASAVTLSSLPDPSQAREPVLLSGSIKGPVTSGVHVTVWRKRPRDKHFRRVLATTSNSDGDYAVLASGPGIDTNVRWYASTRGVSSPVILQRVRALITLTSSTAAAVPGQPVRLTGYVTPWHGGNTALIQQLAANGR
jgi:hypothetical protein